MINMVRELCHADVRACVLGAQNVLFIHLVYDLVDKSTKFVMEVVKIKNWLVQLLVFCGNSQNWMDPVEFIWCLYKGDATS